MRRGHFWRAGGLRPGPVRNRLLRQTGIVPAKEIGSGRVTTNSDGAWELPHEFRQMQETARRFMRERVIPAEKPLPHDAIALPDEVLKPLQEEAKKLGFWHVESPAEWGGAGLNLLGQAVVAEESSQCKMEIGRAHV